MFSPLSQEAATILQDAFDLKDVSVVWQRPQDPAHGDLATPIALQKAKELGKNPRDIAQVLADGLGDHNDIASVEVAGAGYVNLRLTPAALTAELASARAACSPEEKRTEENPVIVEYSQPNIAKPLGIHHIISTVLGQAIANIYRHMGYLVETVNHIGDWGTQFGKLYVGFQKWGTKDVSDCSVDDLLDIYVRFHEEAEKDPTLDDDARAAFAKIEQGDPELKTFWEETVRISMEEIEKTYKRLNVFIEHEHGESMYEDMMMPILDEGKQKGVFKEGKGGALIAEFPEETHMPPAIVLKADGATIYHTRDLATIQYRIERWHPQAILHVVDVSQELYFKQLFAMGQQLEWESPHWEHVIIGRMSFADRSMSTRKGNILRLEHVLDEAFDRAKEAIKSHGDSIQTDDVDDLAEMMGVGSLSYGVLSQNRKMNMIFDWDKFLSFDGNSAPYLQYTHARARSVLRKGPGPGSGQGLESLEEKERVLVGTLLQFATSLEEARAQHMPHILANYLYQLCQDFNTFYNDTPILKAEQPERSLRLQLTELTADVLKVGAELLTLRVPDRM